MKTCSIIFVLVISSLTVWGQAQPDPPYKRFPTLPPLKLLLTDSVTQFTDKDLKKNKAVFLFIFSPDCDHCQKETEELIEKIDSFKNIQIVMATILPFDKMKSFYETYKLSQYPNIIVGHDYQYLLSTYYRMRTLPFLAFYDKKGNLIDGVEGALPLTKVLRYFNN